MFCRPGGPPGSHLPGILLLVVWTQPSGLSPCCLSGADFTELTMTGSFVRRQAGGSGRRLSVHAVLGRDLPAWAERAVPAACPRASPVDRRLLPLLVLLLVTGGVAENVLDGKTCSFSRSGLRWMVGSRRGRRS